MRHYFLLFKYKINIYIKFYIEFILKKVREKEREFIWK